MTERERKPTFNPQHIRDLSERVYRIRLEQECDGNIDRMIAKDGDGGAKLRGRCAAYDALSRAYLEALGITPEGPNSALVGPSTNQGA